MRAVSRRLLGLCLPPVSFAALDATLTLIGQSEEYWAGDYARVNELSPTLNHLLQFHPVAFVAGLVVWMGIVTGVVLLLPEVLAVSASIAVTVAHAAGAATWLLWRFRYGYQACNGLFLCAALALGVGITRGWRAVPAPEDYLQRWPGWLRWTVIAALFGVAVYLFLWPRTT